MRIIDVVMGVTDFAATRLSARRPPQSDDERALTNTASPGALGSLETRLAGVVVAALKEAFDRDNRRLDLEREQIQAERLRLERALRLEMQRQIADRELGRLRLTAGVAVVSWLGTLFFSTRLIEGGVASRVVLGAGWALLLAALAASFIGQSEIMRAVARADRNADEPVQPGAAGTVAAWLIVVGLAVVGAAVLMT
jgi:hypothetical protein